MLSNLGSEGVADIDAALSVLKATSYFHDASDSLLIALAGNMKVYTVDEGFVFIEEGEPMTKVLILESGILTRSKLSVQKEDLHLMKSSIQRRTSDQGTPSTLSEKGVAILASSIIIDEICGTGSITGLFHNMKDDHLSFAYATVTAKTSKTKVWVLAGNDFRSAIAMNPEHCFDVLHAMARELRTGSKSLQGLLQKVRNSMDGKATVAVGVDSKKIIKCLCYDTTSWVKEGFEPAVVEYNKSAQSEKDKVCIVVEYTTERLSEKSSTYAAGYDVVCLFVNDDANDKVIQSLSLIGVKMIAMRCAGFDRIDTKAALAYGMTVARVPAYSPYAVAEMAIALLMSLNRNITKANSRVKMANFTLDAGLMGMDIFGKNVGVMGTGKIGQILCNIIKGFGANLLCYDLFESDEVKKIGGIYVSSQDEIYAKCDVIFLMMPLFPSTRHTINEDVVQNKLKKGVLLINTSRGALIDTEAVLKGLQAGIIGGLGMDVYENEAEFFFQDWSARSITDTTLVTLLGQNNVILTAHQAFFTKEAVTKIVDTTLENIVYYANGLTSVQHPNNCIPKAVIPH